MISNFFFRIAILSIAVFFTISVSANELPYLIKKDQSVQMIIDGKPFLMIAGELHNSSASTPEYLQAVVAKIKNTGINTILLPVTWELYEPVQGVYNNDIVDNVLKIANQANLKVGLLWFGSWKNGVSSYTPLWVKSDNQYLKLKDKSGLFSDVVSPFCEKTLKADKNAFLNLMNYLKKADNNKTVIIVQVQNEVGAFQDMDYNTKALELFNQNVPQQLVDYLQRNKKQLSPEMKQAWIRSGYKTKGNWTRLFGDTLNDDKNFFMSWYYAVYINEMCKAAKLVYPLPMFVNAWIVQNPTDLPGRYPNGGPVSRVLDIYKAAGTHIDFCAPDIYKKNFKEIVNMYHRYDNPLFIPESTFDAGRAFYAFGQHDAICYSPFGYDNVLNVPAYSPAMQVLNEMSETILKYQGTGKMRAFLRENSTLNDTIVFDDVKIIVDYRRWNESIGYGIIIRTKENEFLIAGVDANIRIMATKQNDKCRIASVEEGEFKNNKWHVFRYLNGDETDHNNYVLLSGRNSIVTNLGVNGDIPPQPDPNMPVNDKTNNVKVNTPAIYKVQIY